MSRWSIIYTLVIAIVGLATINAIYIVHYWPAITSFAGELYQCAAGSR
jgi:hypothetical protein